MNKMIKKASEEYFKEKYKAKKFKAYHKRYYAIQQIIIKLKNLYGL